MLKRFVQNTVVSAIVFGLVLPTGQGLFSFRDMDDIVTAIEAIEADLDKHSQAAVDIAESYFRAEIVLDELLARMGF